ncbi:MAG: 3'-5' exonuclease [Eubacterium sp.]
MKSMLSQFKKIQTKPLAFILEQLDLSEQQLLRLLEIWVSQNAISAQNNILIKLKKWKNDEQKKKYDEKLNQDLLLYRELRINNYSNFQIAQKMNYPYDKLYTFLKKWYSILRYEGLSNEAISKKLNATKRELNPIIYAFDERMRQREENLKRRRIANKRYADKHLKHIQHDLNGSSEYFIFDIEAVQCPDELIEIAIIDCKGSIIYNTLVRPSHKINWRISALTGITNKMVQNKPSINTVMHDLKQLISGKTLMSWGIDYDSILLNRSSITTGIDLNCNFCCAQKIHMGLVGDTNQIALQRAADCDSQNHRALDDCRLVLDVLKKDIALINPKPTEIILPKENKTIFISQQDTIALSH